MLPLTIVGTRCDGDVPLVLVRVAGASDTRVLCLVSSVEDYHALGHELEGHMTIRSQALLFLDQAVRSLGARPAAVHLVRGCAPGTVAARLMLDRAGVWSAVPAEPAQAIAVAQQLAVPLWAEQELFAEPRLC